MLRRNGRGNEQRDENKQGVKALLPNDVCRRLSPSAIACRNTAHAYSMPPHFENIYDSGILHTTLLSNMPVKLIRPLLVLQRQQHLRNVLGTIPTQTADFTP